MWAIGHTGWHWVICPKKKSSLQSSAHKALITVRRTLRVRKDCPWHPQWLQSWLRSLHSCVDTRSTQDYAYSWTSQWHRSASSWTTHTVQLVWGAVADAASFCIYFHCTVWQKMASQILHRWKMFFAESADSGFINRSFVGFLLRLVDFKTKLVFGTTPSFGYVYLSWLRVPVIWTRWFMHRCTNSQIKLHHDQNMRNWTLLLQEPCFVCSLLLGRPIFARLLFLRFEDQKRIPSLSYCFASIFMGLRLSRPALKPFSKLALKCFVLIFMVSRHWSSRLALRPAFNFVSSYKLFVLLQYPSTWSLEACLEAVPLRQLRPKILARQHSCQLLQVQPCWDFNNSII